MITRKQSGQKGWTRNSAVALLALLVATPALSSDFRGLDWGATKADVVAIEGEPRLEMADSLSYTTDLVGVTMSIDFTFLGGGLTAVEYDYSPKKNYEDSISTVYSSLIEALEFKYGTPVEGGAISPKPYPAGSATWRTDRTEIQLFAIADESGGVLSLSYRSTQPARPAIDKAAEAAKL